MVVYEGMRLIFRKFPRKPPPLKTATMDPIKCQRLNINHIPLYSRTHEPRIHPLRIRYNNNNDNNTRLTRVRHGRTREQKKKKIKIEMRRYKSTDVAFRVLHDTIYPA